MTDVPKYASTEPWSDERLAWAALAEAIVAGARFQEGMDRALATLADAMVLPPDPVERDRQAVAAIVAGWDLGGRP